jgi:competence/damage-inducible protein CinA-like protein
MPSAEIIAIGTELLLGMTLDTNTSYLANQLRAIGIDLYRTTVIGDNEERITQLVQEALSRADIVITTGGLGPTVDDPTRSAIAKAYNVPLDFHPELWEEIAERFKKFGRVATENNQRQAFLPRNAQVIPNPVGTAPAFSIFSDQHLLISLPGVPKEMEFLFKHHVSQLILDAYPEHASIITKIVHLIGIGESHVDHLIGELEVMHNPTVGLSAKSGQIDIRITAKALSEQDASALIQPVLNTIHQKLQPYIFGEDGIQLSEVISNLLEQKQERLTILLFNHFQTALSEYSDRLQIKHIEDIFESHGEIIDYFSKTKMPTSGIQLAFAVFHKPDKMELHIINDSQPELEPLIRSHLGPKDDFQNWVTQNELGYLFALLKS